MSELLEKIKSRGYWQISIRPRSFNQNRVADISMLLSLLSRCVVQIRGWDFPHIDQRSYPEFGNDWVGQESDWDYHKGIWRLYQSGQFVYLVGMAIDWREESNIWPADTVQKPMTLLGVGDTIFTFTEIMEFASQLAMTDAGDDAMHIDVKVVNIQGRFLYVDSPRRMPFTNPYRTSMTEFQYSKDISRSELLSSYKSNAIDASVQLFKRFGWNAQKEILQDWYQHD